MSCGATQETVRQTNIRPDRQMIDRKQELRQQLLGQKVRKKGENRQQSTEKRKEQAQGGKRSKKFNIVTEKYRLVNNHNDLSKRNWTAPTPDVSSSGETPTPTQGVVAVQADHRF